MNVIVTGSGGMLGSKIVDYLSCCESVTVYAATSQLIRRGGSAVDNGKVIPLDNNHALKLLNANKVDILIHCAFPRDNVGVSLAKGLEFSRDVFSSAKDGCSIINISSQSVYSQTKNRPAVERNLISPQSSYGIAKYATELMLETACHRSRFTNIRLSSLLDPRFEDRFVNKMVKTGLLSGRIRIMGPNNIFGFLSVKDAAAAICSMVLAGDGVVWKPVYNLGPVEEGLTLKQIGAEVCSGLVDKGHRCIVEDCTTGDHEANSSLNSSLFYRDFRWQPEMNMANIVSEIVDYYDESGEEKA